ncbi:MAG: hypothetical protein HOC24_07535 [Deltaproteobacteria bacterium]|nr:hypothetical protein [Deltaproteobacteria bacterium]
MKTLLFFLSILIFTGCNTTIKTHYTYVSPLKYKEVGCEDLSKEIERTGEEFLRVSKAHSSDMAAAGFGFGLIGLAVTSSSSSYVEENRLNGEIVTLIEVSSEKECTLSEGAVLTLEKVNKYNERRKAMRESTPGIDGDE